MNTIIPTRVAIIIFALIIAVFGVRNIMQAHSMYVPEYMPGGASFWVYFTGVCMILAAMAILLNNSITMLACYLLALMFILFVLMLHLKPAMEGNEGNLLRDLAFAMTAIIIGNLAPRRRVV